MKLLKDIKEHKCRLHLQLDRSVENTIRLRVDYSYDYGADTSCCFTHLSEVAASLTDAFLFLLWQTGLRVIGSDGEHDIAEPCHATANGKHWYRLVAYGMPQAIRVFETVPSPAGCYTVVFLRDVLRNQYDVIPYLELSLDERNPVAVNVGGGCLPESSDAFYRGVRVGDTFGRYGKRVEFPDLPEAIQCVVEREYISLIQDLFRL